MTSPAPLPYDVDAARPYGRKWGDRRPPGLPLDVRAASVPGAAYPAIRTYAEGFALGRTFINAMVELADGESDGSYGLPAIRFDVRLGVSFDRARAIREHLVPDPYGPRRPEGRDFISAWGVYSWNRDAGRDTLGLDPRWFPWHWSPAEEVERPIAWYAVLWRRIRREGGLELDAARGVRLWHASPAEYARYVRRANAGGWTSDAWRAAWERVDDERARIIDEHFDAAGIF